MARARRTAPARSRSESTTALLTVVSMPRSAAVYLTSWPASGNPSARKKRRVVSSGQSTFSASCAAVYVGTRRSRSRRPSGAVVGGVAGVPGLGEPVQLVGDDALDLLDVGDVLERHPALLAGVGDVERAAAEDPVDQADVEVDLADPVQ